jgi:beta-glucosidase
MADPDAAILAARVAALDLEAKVRLLTGATLWALHALPEIGLRSIVMSDGPAGVRGTNWDERDSAANVPSSTALAATWDEARVERIGALLAAECRRKGVDVLLAPTVNLHRTPYGGRHFECFSEDPLLTARIGVAYVNGLQRAGVGATVKHFVANDSETERFTYDAHVDERTLRELYLAPFEAIVKQARPWAVMAAYNRVDGVSMTESPLLRELLKDEWQWDGVVVSDWFACRTTEAAGAAALDLAMPGPDGPWGDALVEAVRSGRVSEAAIDDKVTRLLRLGARVGALDGPALVSEPWSDAAVAAELRSTAAASFVLARNDGGVLPLSAPQLKRVAVIGRNAAVARTMGGGSASVFPPYTVSPLDGLRRALPDAEVTYARGVRTDHRLPVVDLESEFTFLAEGDRVVHRERLRTGRYFWQGSLGDTSFGEFMAVEVRARITAEHTGEYTVGCTGVGHARIAANGSEVLDATLELPSDAGPGAALLHPPQVGAPLRLREGDDVELVLRLDLTSRDSEELQVALNLDEPILPDAEEIRRAAAIARDADVAIVVVGTTEDVESEGFDRATLSLPGHQDELVRAVRAANPRTVVVVNSGSPVLLPWADEVPAILLSWFAGQELGNALADVLLGVSEPGGRLPTTWPATEVGLPSSRPEHGVLEYTEGLRIGYRADGATGRQVLFPFGHGLGYADWEYLSVQAPRTVTAGEDLTVRVRLRNMGRQTARETVQIYASCLESRLERPRRWLVGFTTVEARSDEEVAVDVAVAARAFAHWSVETGAWAYETSEDGGVAGIYQLQAGRSSADLRSTTSVDVGPAGASPISGVAVGSSEAGNVSLS